MATGSNTGETDDFTGSCGGTGGLDVCFTWAASGADNYQIDTFGGDYDTVLHIYQDNLELACNDQSGGNQSMAAVDLGAGESIVIVVVVVVVAALVAGGEGGVEGDDFGLETARNLGRRVAELAARLGGG